MAGYKLMIAQFPGVGGLSLTYADASGWVTKTALDIARNHPEIEVTPWRLSDTPITMSRNRCVRDALAQGADYLLMIDSDMDPDCELGEDPFAKPFFNSSWDFLMKNRDTPGAVAAPYVGPPPFENVYIFQWTDFESHTPDFNFALNQFSRAHAADRAGVEKVAALPTGLILYDTRVFKTMKPVKDRGWFYYEWTDDTCSEKASTEDVTQTRDMAIAWHVSGGRQGGVVWCNWDAWAAHLKTKRCRKPKRVPADSISENIREVVLANRRFDARVVNVGKAHYEPRKEEPNGDGTRAPAGARPAT